MREVSHLSMWMPQSASTPSQLSGTTGLWTLFPNPGEVIPCFPLHYFQDRRLCESPGSSHLWKVAGAPRGKEGAPTHPSSTGLDMAGALAALTICNVAFRFTTECQLSRTERATSGAEGSHAQLQVSHPEGVHRLFLRAGDPT